MPLGMNSLGFTTGAMGADPYETEEQRRRRLEEEAAATRAKTTPVKQTITTDPITGEQTVKIEGSARDLSADNPFTPTVTPSSASAPGQVAVATPVPEQPRLQPTQLPPLQQQQTQAPLSAPPVQSTPMPAPAQQMATPLAPPGMPAVAAPVDPTAGEARDPVAQAAADAQGVPTAPTAPTAVNSLGSGLRMPVATGTDEQIDYVLNSGIQGGGRISEKQFNKIGTDPNANMGQRRAAIAIQEQKAKTESEMNKATKAAQEMMASGDQKGMARAIKGSEGSYIKAAFLSALGAKDLARVELEKLGVIEGKWSTQTNIDGKKAVIQTRTDGMPVRGFDEQGRELLPDQLIAFGSTKGKTAFQKGETFVDSKGNAFAQSYNPNTDKFSYAPIGHESKPIGQLVRSTQSSTLAADVAGAKETAVKKVQLRYDPLIAAAKAGAEFIGKFNAENGTNFRVAGTGTGGDPIIVDDNTGQLVTADSTGSVTGTTKVAGGGGGGGGSPAQRKADREVDTAGRTTRIQESVKSVEKLSTDVAQTAEAAGQSAVVARRIKATVTENPQIAGILTKRNNNGSDIITATMAFIDRGLGGSDALESAIQQMNFSKDEVALYDQVKGDLIELSLARARENKGQGTFTDFERRMFSQTTGDIARNSGRAILYRMEIFEYAADKAQRKSTFVEDYLANKPNATAGQIQNAWRNETKSYDAEFEERMRKEYISPKFKVRR